LQKLQQNLGFAAHKSAGKPAPLRHDSDAAFSSLVEDLTRPYDIYENAGGKMNLENPARELSPNRKDSP
jgi:hypothetical protein